MLDSSTFDCFIDYKQQWRFTRRRNCFPADSISKNIARIIVSQWKFPPETKPSHRTNPSLISESVILLRTTIYSQPPCFAVHSVATVHPHRIFREAQAWAANLWIPVWVFGRFQHITDFWSWWEFGNLNFTQLLIRSECSEVLCY